MSVALGLEVERRSLIAPLRAETTQPADQGWMVFLADLPEEREGAEALPHARKLAEDAPTSPAAVVSLAAAELNAGNVAEAAAIAKSVFAMSLGPADIAAGVTAGWLLHGAGESKEAET